jgi:hypothetical protein
LRNERGIVLDVFQGIVEGVDAGTPFTSNGSLFLEGSPRVGNGGSFTTIVDFFEGSIPLERFILKDFQQYSI